MLSDHALAEFCQRQQLSNTSIKVIGRVRQSDPSRRVKSSWGNVSCRFTSRKMRVTIQAESHSNELAALYLWEHDPNVHEFYDQPEPIKLKYAKENGRKIGVTHTS
ncbi:integrase, partial [Pseudomonas sp. MWU13-2860]